MYIVVVKDIIFLMNSEDNGVSSCENYNIDCGSRISRVRRDHLGPYRDSALLRSLSTGYVACCIAICLFLPFNGNTGDETVFEKLKSPTEILAFFLLLVFGAVKLFSDDEKVIRTILTGRVRSVT